jgi:hypothetical protein
MKKALTELTEQELLDLASSPEQVKVYNFANDVMEFISVYQFKTGEHLIPSKLLYKIYHHWSSNPLRHAQFSHQMTDIFPSKGSSILLDKEALELKNKLLEFLTMDDKRTDKAWGEHFNNYLIKFNIKSGLLPIKDSVLYSLYSKAYCKKKHPLGTRQFNNFCKVHFKYELINGHCWFRLDRSIEEHLTEELIIEMSNRGKAKK